MLAKIVKHELNLNFLTKRIWLSLSATIIIFSLLYKWLLKQYIIVSQSHLLGQNVFGITEEVVHPYFAWIALFSVFTIPLMTCYGLIKDRKSGAIVLYKTTPVLMSRYLFGQFFARLTLIFLVVTMLSILPLSLLIDAKIDLLHYISAYIGVILLCIAVTGVSLFSAVITNNIVSAMGLSYFIIISLSFLEWCAQFSNSHFHIIQSIGFLFPIKNFLSGNIFLIDIIYYMYLATIFLVVSSVLINKREELYDY